MSVHTERTVESRIGLLAQLQLADDDRGAPQRRYFGQFWLVLALVAAAAFGLGMCTRSATNPVSAVPEAPQPVTQTHEAAKQNVSAAPTRTDFDTGGIALEATGYVVARQKATVSSQIEGLVTEVLVEEGDHVAAGQVLARLDPDLLTASHRLAQAELDAARAKLPELVVRVDESEAASRRAESLLRDRQISGVDAERARFGLAAARAAKAQLRREVAVAEHRLALQSARLAHTEIRAPFAGVVVNKAAQPGEIISPYSGGAGSSRTGICTIVDMSSIEIEVDINEMSMSRVHPGQRVTATLPSWPDSEVPAQVITIVPTADRSRGTIRVRIEPLERDGRMLPDMAVRVAFAGEAKGETPHD